jgi:hypothetical protein
MPEIGRVERLRTASAMSNEPCRQFFLAFALLYGNHAVSLICVRDSMITILYDTIEFGSSGDETIECVWGEAQRGAYDKVRIEANWGLRGTRK